MLTATAGFVDGVGFVALGGFYTSFMSGNTTQLGTKLASGDFYDLVLPAGLIVLFFIGSFLGTLAGQGSRRWGASFTLVVVVAGVALTLGLHRLGFGAAQAMLSLAAAAGAQNAILQPMGAARLGATFVTGTLFAAGQDLARATNRSAPPLRWLQHLMVWAALCLGALLGAAFYARWTMDALLVPATIYMICLGWFTLRRPFA
jgi:uncharacterized membrane protein YoaK (UPF0700 family)